jgi:competence protein ComEA
MFLSIQVVTEAERLHISRRSAHPLRRRTVGADMKIDLNTADQATLDGIQGLKGHGHEIVRYREERGGFTDVGQLEEVPGLTGKVDAQTLAGLEIGRR